MRNYSDNSDLSYIPIDGLRADKNNALERISQCSERICALKHEMQVISSEKWGRKTVVKNINRELKRRQGNENH